jgi:PLP dependent protein
LNRDQVLATLRHNLETVQRRMAAALARSGRDAGAAKLIAVTKQRPVGIARALRSLGVRRLGENRIQDALPKIAALAAPNEPGAPTGDSAEVAVEWHLIGHLQSNKARRAVTDFAWIHSLDDAELVRRIDRIAGEEGKRPHVLLQLNVSGEDTKHGAVPGAATEALFDAAADARNLHVAGLMTMAPAADDPETARPWFRMLREIRDRARDRFAADWGELSMGMSNDFEVALEEGATLVRVGSALFDGITVAADDTDPVP